MKINCKKRMGLNDYRNREYSGSKGAMSVGNLSLQLGVLCGRVLEAQPELSRTNLPAV